MKNYEFLEHTADIYVRIKGKDLVELFNNAASAMFEIIAEARHPLEFPRGRQDTPSNSLGAGKTQEIAVRQQADNLEELFINWLNELLSLSAAKELIFSNFKIKKLGENNLEASIYGSDIKNYRVNTEIKAATYHQLKIKKTADSWQAEVIFDV